MTMYYLRYVLSFKNPCLLNGKLEYSELGIETVILLKLARDSFLPAHSSNRLTIDEIRFCYSVHRIHFMNVGMYVIDYNNRTLGSIARKKKSTHYLFFLALITDIC